MGQEKINQLARASGNHSSQRFLLAEDIIEEVPDRPKIRAGLHDTLCHIPALNETKMPDLIYFKNPEGYCAAISQ